jgi:hypothetical protein
MKRIVIALLLVLIASSAAAQTIYQIQTGEIAENTIVQVQNVTVTATRYNGIFISEPPFAEYNSIWVYTGDDLGFVPGDIVNVQGEYYEYYDLSEIDAGAGVVAGVGTGPVPVPAVVPAMVLLDPVTAEPWECCAVTIPDQGYAVDVASSYGEWDVDYGGGGKVAGLLLFDDFWYDAGTVVAGDCYRSVTGIIYYSFGAYRMNPYETGIDFCPVATDEKTFGSFKALYR